jgi:hypothetical protein
MFARIHREENSLSRRLREKRVERVRRLSTASTRVSDAAASRNSAARHTSAIARDEIARRPSKIKSSC